MLKDKLTKDDKWGQTSMLCTWKGKRTCFQTKRWCPRRTNVGLDRVSIIPWDWSVDDIQTRAWTCRQACKDAKKQRKWKGWHKASKASMSTSHVNVAWSGERCASRTLTPWRCISQVVTSKQALEGTDVTTQASGPKYQQAQAYRRHKACQSLDLDRQTWIYSIEASKQTYTCIKEMIQTLWYRPRCMDVGLDHKI